MQEVTFFNERPAQPSFFLSLQKGKIQIDEGFSVLHQQQQHVVVAIKQQSSTTATIFLSLVMISFHHLSLSLVRMWTPSL
jgi:hypothetical protein